MKGMAHPSPIYKVYSLNAAFPALSIILANSGVYSFISHPSPAQSTLAVTLAP